MANIQLDAFNPKPSPVLADQLYLSDTENSGNEARVTVSSIQTAVLNPANLTAKTTPILADLLIVGDSAASNVAKKSTLTQVQTTLVTPTAVNAAFAPASLPTKAIPIGADSAVIMDSAASNASKTTTLTEIQTAIVTGARVATVLSPVLTGPVIMSTGGVTSVNSTTLTAKATPILADAILVGDSAASGLVKQSTLTEIQTAIVNTASVNSSLNVNALTSKTVPVLADELIVADSAASFASKKTTGTQLQATLVSTAAVTSALGLPALSTGIVKVTTTTGALTTALTSDFPLLNQNTTGSAGSVLSTGIGSLNALTTKATPVAADEFIIADSAAAFANKKVTGTALQSLFGGGGSGTVTSVGISSPAATLGVTGSPVTTSGTIHLDLSPGTMTIKSLPILSDLVVLGDSASSSAPVTSTLAEVRSAILAGVAQYAYSAAVTAAELSTAAVKVVDQDPVNTRLITDLILYSLEGMTGVTGVISLTDGGSTIFAQVGATALAGTNSVARIGGTATDGDGIGTPANGIDVSIPAGTSLFLSITSGSFSAGTLSCRVGLINI